MGRFDEAVELWREVTAEPRYHVALKRTQRAHERAVRRYQRRLVHLRRAVGSRAVLAGSSGVAAGGLAVADHATFAAACVAGAVGLGLSSWQARRQLAVIQPPAPPLLPVRPGSRAAVCLTRLDALAERRRRLALCVHDAHALEALTSAAEAETLLRSAISRLSAIEETATGEDPATAEVTTALQAEIDGGLESYEGVLSHAVRLAGVVTAGGSVAAALDDAAAALEARTYGLRRLGEVGLA
jgi:hypothetical protein